MRKINCFSAFQIKAKDYFGFSPADYSKFKHGSKSIARKYGIDLADKFISSYSSLLKCKQWVVFPSAYSHIQTASCIMESFFVDRLNFFLFQNNCSPVEQVKIHRSVTYREDYGEMSAEKRFNLIKGDKFYVDKSILGDKNLLFIDDIKITGTHEKVMIKMLDDYNIYNDCYMLYFAELKNPEIDPCIENFLNQYFVKNIHDLDQIIRDDSFVFNTRVVKFILNSSQGECMRFLSGQSLEFIRDLFFLAIGNSYGQFDDYRQNLINIQEIVQESDESVQDVISTSLASNIRF